MTMTDETNIIAKAAVLCELNLSVWGASRVDRSATEQVVNTANAVRDAAQVRKNLFAGTSIRKDISDYAAGCRMWHNRQTMPWADKGARLLPTSLFLDYKTEANARKAEFDSLVSTFLTAYPQLVQDAQRSMGSLFNASDYPDVAEVAAKFDFRLVFSPVPDVGDFRVQVGTDAMAELRESYDSAFSDRLAEVTREPWNRLHELLTGMSEKMAETEPMYRTYKGEKKEVNRPYHESFLTNAQAMCGMLKHLNITNDPKLEHARMSLEAAIFCVDMPAVREDPATRARIKADVDAILATHNDFW